MNEIVDYPVWRVALRDVLERVDEHGHGVIFTHDELKHAMGIKEAETVDEVKKLGFDYMQGIDKLKGELLFEHNIWLESIRGQGYQVLMPEDQVKIPPDKHIRRARGELNKAKNALINIKTNLLDYESENMRVIKLARIGFLKTAFNKRKILLEGEQKKIESTNNIEDITA